MTGPSSSAGAGAVAIVPVVQVFLGKCHRLGLESQIIHNILGKHHQKIWRNIGESVELSRFQMIKYQLNIIKHHYFDTLNGFKQPPKVG